MKKILGVVALLSIVVLTACGGGGGGSETIVCTLEYEGIKTETTIYAEDGYAVRSVMSIREYNADGANDDDLDLIRDLMGDGVDIEIEGDYVVITHTIDFDEDGDGVPVDDVVGDLEFQGYECD